jgi:trigger factor
LKTDVTELGSYKRRVEIEVPYQEVEPHLEKAYRKYQKKIHIDGFRKGKVPLSLVRKQFGDAIQAEVADDLIQTFFKKAIEEQNLAVVSAGSVKEMSFNKEEPFSFVVEVEVEPAVTIKDYKGLKVEKEIHKVTKEDIVQLKEAVREQKAESRDWEAGAEESHIIEGSLQAMDASGVPIIGKKWDPWAVELGRPPIGDQIKDQLTGVKAGEERRFEIRQPQKTPDGKVQEQIDYYLINVSSVKEKILPAWDDVFARENGNFETIADFEKDIREKLVQRREEEAERILRSRIADEIIKRNDFEVPPSMVDNMLDRLWDDYQKQPEQRLTEEQYREENKGTVVWRIKWHLLQQAIIDQEEIQVSEEDVDTEINTMIEASPQEEKKIRSWLKTPERRQRLRDNLLEEKVMAFFKEHAKIKEVSLKPSKKSIITS